MMKEISHDSQELFRLIAENIRDYAVFVTDLEGHIVSWNPGVESLLGYAEGNWIGEHASIIFTPEDRERGEHLWEMETALREGRAEDKRWHMRRDGSRFWADGVLMLLRDGEDSPRAFAKILRDSTEAKLTEERLRESEERFQRLVELSPDAIAVHAEGVVLFINTAGSKLLCADSPEQIVGRSIASLINPDYHALIRERIGRVSRGETPPPAEIKFIRLDGTEIYGELASAPLVYQGRPAVQAVVRDLTRRKQAEEALRESEKRFRLIFNQQFQFMAILSPEGILLDINELPLRAAGVTRDEVLGRLFWETPWWEGLPEMQAGWPARLASAARSDTPVFSVDFYQAADGTRVADASITAVKTSDGSVEFFIIQASDITERKRVEEERERLLQEAQEANRLKDEFLATVSHELRTPLTAILGWSHLLRGGQLEDEGAARALETIERNARSQSQLIDDLLDVSRIVTGKLRLEVVPVSPHSFIDPAVEAVRPAAEAKGVRLQKVIDTGVGAVMGDPARLQQVVWNLLTNAVKFTPRDGRVQVSLVRVNSHVEIAVSDTGAGIDPEFLPHVFERFRQADQKTTRQHGGLGLGLAIVRHLVELHGGSVRADSAGQGAGATFTVMLPIAAVVHPRGDAEGRAHAAARNTLPPHECPERLDGVKVLVVDDEPDARELLSTGLGHCGAQVTAASSAPEALEAISGAKFDVLISDIGMPGEDGYELIRRVRALPPGVGGSTPAVALTAYARAEDRLRALRAGFEMHISKPVELTELVIVIANLTRRSGQN
ncbi:MAG TPA: PAS domain S-box protein [Pyrinomonadaceae bacterium]|nr:PAS domain S-box protein [Pyrinomonadaceae bacterium]